MRSLLQWAIKNSPAINAISVAVLLIGAISVSLLRREVFPEFELEIILVSVDYPGASPVEVEEGICLKIEEAVGAVDGIKRKTSIAREGAGFLVLELETYVDVQKTLKSVRAELDRIPSFPDLAEDPKVEQITFRTPAIRVGVLGPQRSPESAAAEWQLRAVAEQVRDELLLLPAVSQVNILGERPYQVDIEIPEETLRQHGLTLRNVADQVRRENVEIPGGTIRTESQEVVLRSKNKQLWAAEMERIPLVTLSSGVVLTVADLGTVHDRFTDDVSIHQVNGRPAQVLSVDRTSREDLLAMVQDVRRFADHKQLPEGYELVCWHDESIDVKDRMDVLLTDGWQGLLLVFLLLGVFLEIKLAFWVASGIPFAMCATCAVLLYCGQTVNMLTMFAFLMALGILVDDAIVIGENVYSHRALGKSFTQSAIDGTCEVIPSVISSVLSTTIAFVPLFYVSGVMGKFIAVMPLAIIAMLLISLVEAMFVLPTHLAHSRHDSASMWQRALVARAAMLPTHRRLLGPWMMLGAACFTLIAWPFRSLGTVFGWINRHADVGLDWFLEHIFRPTVTWCVHRPASVVALAAALILVTGGYVAAGKMPFVVMPKLDNKRIMAKITFPDGTPQGVTKAAVERLQAAIQTVDREYQAEHDGQHLLDVVHLSVGYVLAEGPMGPDSRTTGSHVGGVQVELVDTTRRKITSETVLARWREAAGTFAGCERISFSSPNMGPGGQPIEFKLLAPMADMAQLEAAVEQTKTELTRYAGLQDVGDDSWQGKWEFQVKVKDNALSMGVPLADLAETIRGSFYGEEVMRLQRGRHEVKLMVRYPEADRKRLSQFDDIHVRSLDGAERPITELADVTVARGYAEINRLDQMRSITVTADVDERSANARDVVADLQKRFMPNLLQKFPSLAVRWEGQQEQTNESVQSLMLGFLVALSVIYVVLTIEFRSYLQPIIVMVAIPFGFIGAIWGHAWMGLPITLFSLFGLVTLSGIVLNDSIVLIDYVNQEHRPGTPIRQTLIDAGIRRFRPVMLTSITNVAGLIPLMQESSFQAQVLIPMAVSMVYGSIMSTILVLLFVPTLYLIYARLVPQHAAE